MRDLKSAMPAGLVVTEVRLPPTSLGDYIPQAVVEMHAYAKYLGLVLPLCLVYIFIMVTFL